MMPSAPDGRGILGVGGLKERKPRCLYNRAVTLTPDPIPLDLFLRKPLVSGPLFSAQHIGSLGTLLPLEWMGPPLEGLADHSAGVQLLQDHVPVTSSSYTGHI